MNEDWGLSQEIRKPRPYFFSLLVILLILFFGWYISRSQRNFSPARLELEHVFLDIEVADEQGEQIKGLSGRDLLCENCGMLFVYDRPRIRKFWMKGMKFPLDIIFIRDGAVVEIAENVPRPAAPGSSISTVQSQAEADLVLEVNAGFAAKTGVNIGDPILYP